MVKGDTTMGNIGNNIGRIETKQGIEKRRKIMNAIKGYISEQGYSPTIRELAEIVQLSSSSSLHRHIKVLIEEGYISMGKGIPRSIRVLRDYN